MNDESKKEYEISYLLADPALEAEVLAIFKQNGASINYQRPVSSIALAYEIEKHTSAYFGFCHLSLDTQSVKPIDATLRLKKGVLRFLIITPPVKMPVPGEAFAGKPEKKVSAPAAISNEALSEKLEEILK
ncbi:MAG: 30S ribosomal protein S6 [bacterium]|nr:30S ribosomal protein S6 [bacterium]